MAHTCHAVGCEVEVPPKMFACKKHWFTLSDKFRSLIWKYYRPGQEVRKDPSPAYLYVAYAAKVMIAVAEKKYTFALAKQLIVKRKAQIEKAFGVSLHEV